MKLQALNVRRYCRKTKRRNKQPRLVCFFSLKGGKNVGLSKVMSIRPDSFAQESFPFRGRIHGGRWRRFLSLDGFWFSGILRETEALLKIAQR